MTTQAGTIGHAPRVIVGPPPMSERDKYVRLWQDVPDYRAVAPGEHMASTFLQQARPERDAECIDFGCGTGRGALMLALFGGLRVHMLDFADNCLDPDVAAACTSQPQRISFRMHDLTEMPPENAAYGYCCDVMEHIPTADVRKVLGNIMASAQHVFFGISTVPDVMGKRIGQDLHLTVRPMAWWIKQITDLGAIVHWFEEQPDFCLIYCSGWQNPAELVKTGVINTTDAVINAQVRQNIEAGWAHVVPQARQDRECIILAGGPSMRGEIDEIRKLRSEGAALITVNGSYGWAIENGLVPSVQIVLDARAFNARFMRPAVETCRYLVASQCHPDTLAGLPKERTLLWHTMGISDENIALLAARAVPFFPVPGGSTVVLRALPLMRMLGLSQFHLFGFDSCVLPDAHHAYPQPENDGAQTMPINCGGRIFQCAPWQASQATEFMDLVKSMGDEMEVAVYGDGLIKHILTTGASFSSDNLKD